MVIIGVAGTFAGPIIGAFAIIGMEEILSGLTARWHAIVGCLYVAVAMLAFGGVRFGQKPAPHGISSPTVNTGPASP